MVGQSCTELKKLSPEFLRRQFPPPLNPNNESNRADGSDDATGRAQLSFFTSEVQKQPGDAVVRAVEDAAGGGSHMAQRVTN